MSEITQIAGRQIAAARVLSGLGQDDVARRANISVATLRRMEANEAIVSGFTNNIEAVRRALEAAGVEFTNGGQPGVKMNAESWKLTAKNAQLRNQIDQALKQLGDEATRRAVDRIAAIEYRETPGTLDFLREVQASLQNRKAVLEAAGVVFEDDGVRLRKGGAAPTIAPDDLNASNDE